MTLVPYRSEVVARPRRSAEDVVKLFRDRQKSAGPRREAMRDMLNLYEGEIAVPLPEMRREERPSIVNLAKQGINQMGMRAASVMPNIICPPINTGRSEDAEKNAAKRRKTLMAWWDEVGMQIKLRQRGRWLFAYAHAPVMICPDFKAGRPTWRPVSPMDTYPSHLGAFDDMVPSDCIIAALHAVGWCRQQWPEASYVLQGLKDDALCEILHFIDDYEYHTVVTPKLIIEEIQSGMYASGRSLRAATLDWHPNLTGRPWVVIPRSISLENPLSTYQGLIGMYEAQAELDALGKIARRKGVFAEEWLVSNEPNGIAQIVTPADAFAGIVGQVSGGSIVRLAPESQYSTDTGVDRYERNMRIEAGLPSDFGGESSTNVRTGARANALIQNAIDPVLQETHELFSKSLEAEDCIAIAIDKAYWSGQTKTVWLGSEAVSYDPGKVWETDRHLVDYSMAGADLNQLTIVPLQLVGAGAMSLRTMMGLHPLIKDVDKEMDMVTVDKIDQAILASLQTLLTTPGAIPMSDVMKVRNMILRGDADLGEAWEQVQQEAQERQARLAETQAQAMPGMEMQGQGAEQPLGPGPQQDPIANLRNDLGNLRMINMTTPQERGVA
jgi:hypothetical protein